MNEILKFPKLTILDFSYNSGLTEEFFTELAASPVKLALKILKFDGVKTMDSALLMKILKASKDTLQYLSLDNVTFVRI